MYKRQIPRINEEHVPRARSYAMGPTEKELRRRDRQQKKLAKKFSKMQEKDYDFFPVSYTHLDVYKRQELARAAKDAAAGAVLLASAGSVIVGLIVFAPYVLCLLYTSRCV